MAGPTSYEAQIADWIRKQERMLDAIVQQSAADVFELASRVKAGVTRGGTVTPGYVPRDTGFLAASAVFDLNGSQVAGGEAAATFGVTGMKAGDTAVLAWTAVYARKLHYENGWLWVDNAASQWQDIVARNVARAERAVGG